MAATLFAETRSSARAGTSAVEVLGLLREQFRLFVRLESFAQRQRQLVRELDSRPLLTLLSERQNLSSQLTDIARRLAPARNDWEGFRGQLTDVERREAQELWEGARNILGRLIASDEEDARVLQLRKRLVHGEIQSTHQSGAAMNAYRSAGSGSGGNRLDEAS